MQIAPKRVLVYIAIALLFENVSAAENNTTAKRSFTIAIDPEYAPFTLRDADGKASGMFVDFWNLWAKKNGYTVATVFIRGKRRWRQQDAERLISTPVDQGRQKE